MLTADDKQWITDSLQPILTDLAIVKVNLAAVGSKVDLLLSAHPQMSKRVATIKNTQTAALKDMGVPA